MRAGGRVWSASTSALDATTAVIAADGFDGTLTYQTSAQGSIIGTTSVGVTATGGSGGYSVDIYNSATGGGGGGIPGSAGGGALMPGDTWNFQCWYRDIGGTNNFTFGDGLRCAGGGVRRLQVGFADSSGSSQTSVSITSSGCSNRPKPMKRPR